MIPPILVNLFLPATYPQRTAPVVRSLGNPDSSDSWLPSRTERRIRNELQALWAAAEGEGVLWSWVDWLASGAFMDSGEGEDDITRDGEAYMYVVPYFPIPPLTNLFPINCIEYPHLPPHTCTPFSDKPTPPTHQPRSTPPPSPATYASTPKKAARVLVSRAHAPACSASTV